MNETDLRVAQVASCLEIGIRAVHYLIEKGHLAATRFGWAYVITEEALADYQAKKAAGQYAVGRPRKTVKEGGVTDDPRRTS